MSVLDISKILDMQLSLSRGGATPEPKKRWYHCITLEDAANGQYYSCKKTDSAPWLPTKEFVSIHVACPTVFDQMTLSYKLKGPVQMAPAPASVS